MWLKRGVCAQDPNQECPRGGPSTQEEVLMSVIIAVDPHKASHTAVAIGGDECEVAKVTVQRPASRQPSRWRGPSPSPSAPGPSSPAEASTTCWPSSSSMPASTCSTSHPPWPRGSGCSAQGVRRRTIPTTVLGRHRRLALERPSHGGAGRPQRDHSPVGQAQSRSGQAGGQAHLSAPQCPGRPLTRRNCQGTLRF